MVEVELLALLVAQGAVGVCHHVERLGAERIVLHSFGAVFDQSLQLPHLRPVGVDARHYRQHPFECRIGGERSIVLLVGVAVVEVVILLGRERCGAVAVFEHQVGIVIRRRGVHSSEGYVVFVGYAQRALFVLCEERRRQQKCEEQEQSFHFPNFFLE